MTTVANEVAPLLISNHCARKVDTYYTISQQGQGLK